MGSMVDKIKKEKDLLGVIHQLKQEGRKIVMTNGCFDLIHVGHVRYLQEAKHQGDVLIVALNTDQSARSLKGPQRPIVPEDERAEILAALACVDYVILFDEPTPLRLIEKLIPHVLVKGGDWQTHRIVGAQVVENSGGKVLSIPMTPGRSTSNLIEKILQMYQ
jgi:D-beta-D-heptose 7-phosphate kinase/D-beta-D-heptose 1-phosphate adenosyltransferase